MQYAKYVMWPEAIIRIFAKVTNVSLEQAENELKFEADYNGSLSEELIQFVKDNEHLLDEEKNETKSDFQTNYSATFETSSLLNHPIHTRLSIMSM